MVVSGELGSGAAPLALELAQELHAAAGRLVEPGAPPQGIDLGRKGREPRGKWARRVRGRDRCRAPRGGGGHERCIVSGTQKVEGSGPDQADRGQRDRDVSLATALS